MFLAKDIFVERLNMNLAFPLCSDAPYCHSSVVAIDVSDGLLLKNSQAADKMPIAGSQLAVNFQIVVGIVQ